MSNPGSDEAIQQGCTCPVLDNAHGNGIGGAFWISGDCTLHGQNPTSYPVKAVEDGTEAEGVIT